MTEPLRYAVADGVATVTLDRPQARNALDTALKVALRDRLRQAAEDPAVRAVLLTGTGPAFCVGQDLVEHAAALAADPDGVWATVQEHYAPIIETLVAMPKPAVAAVNGVAAGAGAALAFGCDLRLVAASAGFNLAFAGIGLSCDSGVSWTLPRLVGWARARELLLLPRTVPAAEALQLGLATEVVPDAELAARAGAVAAQLAAGPTAAYASIRQVLAFSAAHDLPTALAYEAEHMRRTGTTADHRRAVEAFLRKGRPTFTGS